MLDDAHGAQGAVAETLAARAGALLEFFAAPVHSAASDVAFRGARADGKRPDIEDATTYADPYIRIPG
jgi:hypothetical protein